MIPIVYGNWITDLKNMTCWNAENKIIVAFRKNGGEFEGQIKDMPMEVMSKWANEPHGEWHIKESVMEAKNVFMRGYDGSKGENREG
jgi:hypothetical protein